MHTLNDMQPEQASPAVGEFGRWLLQQLDRREMTRAELSRAANLPSSTITMIINGKNGRPMRPKEETVAKIADALGISLHVVRLAAGYSNPTPNVDLEFCGDLLMVFQTMQDTKLQKLKNHLLDVARTYRDLATT